MSSVNLRTFRLNNICKQIATLGPLGYLPLPGTMGSLAAVPIILACNNYVGCSGLVFSMFILCLSISAIIIINRACCLFNTEDPRQIIIDEVIGCCIALYGLTAQWQLGAIAFIVFRFLDGTKLCGISYIEKKIPGAYGILCDDITAGLLVNISMRLITGNLL